MKFCAIITAGGSSSRFGNSNKLLEIVGSKKIIEYTLETFLKIEEISQVVICAHKSIIDTLKILFAHENRIKIIEGGNTRQQSVYNGLLACESCDYVLIHDGARPMITPEVINRAISAVKEKRALTVATKTIDTIKQVDKNLKIIKTIDRSSLYNTQTPQAFSYELILDAHKKLQGQNYTDDCGMLEALGFDVYILEGDYKNIKITTQADLDIAKAYLV